MIESTSCLIDILLLLTNKLFLKFLTVVAMFMTGVWFLEFMILLIADIQLLKAPNVLVFVIAEITFVRTFQDVFSYDLRITSLLERYLRFYLSFFKIF